MMLDVILNVKVEKLLKGGIQMLKPMPEYIRYYDATAKKYIGVNDLNNVKDYLIADIKLEGDEGYASNITIVIQEGPVRRMYHYS